MKPSLDFYTVENFKIAYQRLRNAGYGDYERLFWRDLECFGLDLEDNLTTLIDCLKERVYKPDTPLKLFVPKANKLIRPITILSFVDLLVYQAIANIIAEKSYENLHIYYNKEVFGNLYNYSETTYKPFFFIKWENQWKDFEHQTKKYYNEGNKFILDFDLASFYDTVDHDLLKTFLIEEKIPTDIIELLMVQLSIWTKDLARNNYHYRHGIPQGPQASSFLSELFIHYIDRKMFALRQKHLDFEYIRYADDIRVFTKCARSAHKYFAYLDLLARDLGLIPQSSKTSIRALGDINEVVKVNEYFSKINLEIRARKKTEPRINNYLIKGIKRELLKDKPDKTVIRFGIYKIEPDDALKKLTLENIYKIPHLFDEVCFYFKKFNDDPDIIDWYHSECRQEPLYTWTLAIVLKYFRYPEKQIELWNKYSLDKKNWYVQYFLLDNLAEDNPEFLLQLSPLAVQFCPRIRQKIFRLKFKLAKTKGVKQDIVRQMCTDPELAIALEGKQLAFEYSLKTKGADNSTDVIDIQEFLSEANLHPFLKSGLQKKPLNYISEILKTKNIIDADRFFDSSNWNTEVYERLKNELRSALNLFDTKPWGIWMIYMDNFNSLIVEHLLSLAGLLGKGSMTSYGALLDFQNCLKENFPRAHSIFKGLHGVRSTRVAHPKDSEQKITTYLNWKDSLVGKRSNLEH